MPLPIPRALSLIPATRDPPALPSPELFLPESGETTAPDRREKWVLLEVASRVGVVWEGSANVSTLACSANVDPSHLKVLLVSAELRANSWQLCRAHSALLVTPRGQEHGCWEALANSCTSAIAW